MSEWCGYCRELTEWSWDSGPHGWCSTCQHDHNGTTAKRLEETSAVLAYAVTAITDFLSWASALDGPIHDVMYTRAPGNRWDLPHVLEEAKRVLEEPTS